jgi:hypothetical protein
MPGNRTMRRRTARAIPGSGSAGRAADRLRDNEALIDNGLIIRPRMRTKYSLPIAAPSRRRRREAIEIPAPGISRSGARCEPST